MNKKAWNIVAPIHENLTLPILIRNFQKKNHLELDKRELGLIKSYCKKGDKIAQICCNNGRELISLSRIGQSISVGFDFSPELIRQANILNKEARASCQFVCTDVYNIGQKYYRRFDFVYISAGTLFWVPDLNKLLTVVRGLLTKNGVIYIYEMHPCLVAYSLKCSYFDIGPHKQVHGLEYYPGSYPSLPPHYVYQYTMTSIIDSLISNHLKILCFREHPYDISLSFPHIKDLHIPLSYTLVAKKFEE